MVDMNYEFSHVLELARHFRAFPSRGFETTLEQSAHQKQVLEAVAVGSFGPFSNPDYNAVNNFQRRWVKSFLQPDSRGLLYCTGCASELTEYSEEKDDMVVTPGLAKGEFHACKRCLVAVFCSKECLLKHGAAHTISCRIPHHGYQLKVMELDKLPQPYRGMFVVADEKPRKRGRTAGRKGPGGKHHQGGNHGGGRGGKPKSSSSSSSNLYGKE